MSNNIFKVSIVVPTLNEESNIEKLVSTLKPILKLYNDYEIIFVDDGSTDNTLRTISEMRRLDNRIKYISFSRNFGHQNALRAGMQYVSGDCMISMDADMQHPPELIPKLVDKWQEGYKIVYTVRKDSQSGSFFKRKTSDIFYNILSKLSNVKVPKGAADFRLLDSEVVKIISNLSENTLFLRGLIAWLGFDQFAIKYQPGERFAGHTKYSLRKMISLALNGITSFSIKPLRLATFFGLIIAVISFTYGIYAIYLKLFTEKAISGWTSVLVSVLFLSGIQLITFGIMGEYIGKLFIESKGRPSYIIKEKKL